MNDGQASRLLGLDAAPSMEEMRWTAKPHPFSGAVLSPKHARELTPPLCLAIAAALGNSRRLFIPYTLWITEAWGVLGWAEPSAALFWEMATMYHTLYLATLEVEDGNATSDLDSITNGNTNNNSSGNNISSGNNNKIPPILSCGSHSSLGSGGGASMDRKKQYSTAASAKELPVWLVATFLLLHCEESAYLRNLSSADDRRVSPNTTTLDFNSLLQQKHSSLSPRTRLQAGSWQQDHLHCTSFLLRHLRKVLLLTAVPHNDEAARACMHLAQTPPSTAEPPTKNQLYSLDWLDQMHKEEHGSVGTSVRLTVEDLEKLHFLLQPPSGGGVDDPPMDIGSYVWGALYPGNPMPNNLTLPLGEVERIICRHLREEIVRHKGYGGDEGGPESTPPSPTEAQLAKLTLEDEDEGGASTQSQQQGYQKELTYTNLRGTTIMLKPENNTEYLRLHDLVISECSDAHFYLLQPFEHVTIAACTGCTVVVGAVAGLLHVVDCEKTQVTSAARRLLASNSADVLSYVFTPSPPLLVGDTRNCQLAPHNTYYEGLREDLLATGLAAAVSTSGTDQPSGNGSVSAVNSLGWPPLQCASNKWKQPVELSKLELPQVGGSETMSETSSASNEARNLGGSNKTDDAAMQTPILLPASEFHVLFCPVVTPNFPAPEEKVEGDDDGGSGGGEKKTGNEALYCQALSHILQYSPFRLPVEYERQALVKADRMRNLQQLVKRTLTDDQRRRFEEELNRGFRDWLVTSGNLRQVLDLVHMEKEQRV